MNKIQTGSVTSGQHKYLPPLIPSCNPAIHLAPPNNLNQKNNLNASLHYPNLWEEHWRTKRPF